MATLNNELTRDLYHAGVSRHAFTLLVDLARAYKHASNTEREALKRLSEEGAHLYYDPDWVHRRTIPGTERSLWAPHRHAGSRRRRLVHRC